MQYIGFTLNNSEYSIPILKVREIINVPRITKMPQFPLYIEGITNLRGDIIPIVNVKKIIRMDGDENKGNRVIVVSSGEITFGMLVDGITGVMDIDESAFEPAERFLRGNVEQVEGVAHLSDRLIVLLDPQKLLPLEDVSFFEDYVDIQGKDSETVKAAKTVRTMAEEVKEFHAVKDFFEKRGIDSCDPRYIIFDDIINFMNALASQDYEKADSAVQNIIKKGQSNLFIEVGKITRKLHDSLRSFRESIDPKFKEIATVNMPNAIDSLQFVIDKTEEAANKTLEIVEKYILSMDEFASRIRNVKEPEASVNYLKDFKNKLEDDLTEILTTQSFQDITGQTLKKVIKLIGDIEEELVRLIANFGLKIDQGVKTETMVPVKVSQNDVDDLLKEFGF